MLESICKKNKWKTHEAEIGLNYLELYITLRLFI